MILTERKYTPSDIVEKITAPGSKFSHEKRNLSGWYAIELLTNPSEYKINHRPAWVKPGDDFESVVTRFLAQINS